VRVTGPSGEDELIALFLRGERRCCRERGQTPSPRRDAGVRPRRALFSGFPVDIRWERVVLDEKDLDGLLSIDHDYWVELSGGTRRVVDCARNAAAGAAPFGVPSDGFLEAAAAVRAGHRFPAPILVTAGAGAPVVVLEGHVRVTAHALAGTPIGDALLGTSTGLASWALY
jgi:hypothetical protein